MKQRVKLLILLMFFLAAGGAIVPEETIAADSVKRERLSMDFDWKFSLGHASNMTKDFDYWGGDPSGRPRLSWDGSARGPGGLPRSRVLAARPGRACCAGPARPRLAAALGPQVW